jgi:hypothetical protein
MHPAVVAAERLHFWIKFEEPTVSLGEALDNDSLTWTTGGDAIWYGQTSIHYYDGDAARSGNLTSGVDSSWLQTTVSGPGGLSFFWKVSELSAITDLTFEIDGVEESLCWDFEEWRLQTFKIPSGIHTFKWIYAPVISRSGETGYIDKVLYIKGPAVLSPGWGETWNPREPNLIEWIDIEGTGPEVKLELYKGGSLIYTISASTDNSGNYDWFVPVILEPGSDFQVKLSSITDPSIFAYSEYFTIAESLFPPSFGGLLVLDGDDDFAHTEDHFELDIRDEAGESLTIEAWVYFKTFAHANILYKPEAYFLHGEYEWMSSLKNYCFGFFIWPAPDDLCSYIACRTVLPRAGYTFGWHHVAGVFNSENSDMKIYLNGKLFSDHSCSTIHNSDYPLYLGVGWWSGFMDGAIDEVRISDVARYLDEFDPPTTPFICDDHTRALWHFDELEGDTVFHDDCGYNNLLIGYNGAHASGGGNLGLLNQIIITPDNASLYIGQSQQFSAIGYDQGDNEVSITPIWTATGGTIATGESTVKKTLHDNSVSAVYTALETGNHIVVCTDSSSGIADTAQVSVISTGVLSDVVSPDEFKLFQNHPNPFNTETTIHFNVKQNCHVYMNVVDLLGREIAVLANSQFTPGIHEIVFNGRELPPGLYYYTIRMNSFYDMKRMVLIK